MPSSLVNNMTKNINPPSPSSVSRANTEELGLFSLRTLTHQADSRPMVANFGVISVHLLPKRLCQSPSVSITAHTSRPSLVTFWHLECFEGVTYSNGKPFEPVIVVSMISPI